MILAAVLAAVVITFLWWRQWCLYEASIARHTYVPGLHDHAGAALWQAELTSWPRVRNTQS